MVPLTAVVLPIALSAALVFVLSSILWSLPFWHKRDWVRLPQEEPVLRGLREAGVGRGMYAFPDAGARPEKTWTEEDRRKVVEGPIGTLVVWPPGPPRMAKTLSLWFVLLLLVSTVVGYVASRTLPAGAEYMTVFRLTGTTAGLAYAAWAPVNSIFFAHTWSSTARTVVDGVLYGLLTAGAFAWLWPVA